MEYANEIQYFEEKLHTKIYISVKASNQIFEFSQIRAVLTHMPKGRLKSERLFTGHSDC